MLFAPSALSSTKHAPVTLQQEQINALSHRHHHHNHCNSTHMHGKILEDTQGENAVQTKNEEIVEAMKKLDAKLVAYLAGETNITEKINEVIEKKEQNLQIVQQSGAVSSSVAYALPDPDTHETKWDIFKTIRGLKLEMEALTLQAEGTKHMELLETEIRPIFTIECQLSNELIKNVKRCEMFHVMQFESEKFNSLTQCTRFGQSAERKVRLNLNEKERKTNLNFGCIRFTVWWREPGTCLNEMLGIGLLNLADLYYASLLEQCKRIKIQRRGCHLASLYFKIILQRDLKEAQRSLATVTKQESKLCKQMVMESHELSANDDKVKSTPKQQQQRQEEQNVGSNTSANTHNSCSSGGGNTSTINSNHSANAQNNNFQLETNDFEMDARKIRLLKGLIYVNETRNMELDTMDEQNLFLICRRFWQKEPITTLSDDTKTFNYYENFSVIIDEAFLQRMEKQYLNLELWQLLKSCGVDDDDDNGNHEERILPVGMARVPLHQFFIAFRDADITDRICKGKLPVISLDAWTSIINCQNGCRMGEMRCLLAIGSDDQIENLQISRDFIQSSENLSHYNKVVGQDIWEQLQPMQIATASVATTYDTTEIKQTSDMLEMLQKALITPPPTLSVATINMPAPPPNKIVARNLNLTPLQPSNQKLFQFVLDIQRAINLPLNPAVKVSKKGHSKRHVSKRFPPNEPPSCYVTFQAEEGSYPTFKSHEGTVYATTIIKKSTEPQWNQRFRLAATMDYLYNPQKRFILKIWKKSLAEAVVETRFQPTPMEDAIVGFSALDMTVFLRGLHIGGYLNIVDFNGRINGQLEVRCQPLEDIKLSLELCKATNNPTNTVTTVDSVIDQFEQSLDLAHLNLGQAIKRKFTELEDISQRLRVRLGTITGTTLPTEFNYAALDKWQQLEVDEINDNHELDVFEQDLNTPFKAEDEKNENKNKEKNELENIKKKEKELKPNAAGTRLNEAIEPSE